MNSRVSIIIPCFNRSEIIGETLDSVIAQSHQDWECLVVDDGSDQQTMSILKEYAQKEARVRLFQRPESRPKGANACRNIGLDEAEGDFVMFLDSDDLLAPDCLENRLKSSREFPDADMWIFSMQYFKEIPEDTDRIVNNPTLEEGDSFLKKFLRYEIPWPITGMFFPRKGMELRFDENLGRFQDVDFGLRFILNSSKPIKVFENSKPDCFYRMPQETEQRHLDYDFINRINRSQWKLIQKLIPDLEKTFSDKRELKEHLDLLKNFYFRNFRIYILPYIQHIDTSYKSLRKFLRKKGIISYKTSLRYGVIEYMHLRNWHKKKGTGAYTLTRKWIN